ncbi:MAG: calcium-binding protein [Altererythrobacter sp.]|nr:calcium-binding protein [Altererythrobacter sp.]MBK62319.1 calcium-binding protein [Altererythrobacter sp.]
MDENRVYSASLVRGWRSGCSCFCRTFKCAPGGLAADGCHNDRKNGGRHCHRGADAGQQQVSRRDGAVYYPNCDAARRAGVTPILRGQPGYGTHLDRDGDGKACE